MDIKHYKILIIVSIIIILIIYNYKNNELELYSNYVDSIENNFKIIITTYNPGIKLFKRCLESVEKQKYKNYQVCIVNDASTKDKEDISYLCELYYQKYGWLYVNLKKNVGPCKARDIAIENLMCEPDDIIVAVDGDDELYDESVLNKLNYYYQDKNLLITFGNFVKKLTNGTISDRKSIRIRKNDILNVIKNRSYRKKIFIFSHLKTFKFKLYEKINHDHLKKNGDYFRSATDVAIMFPMLEMAGDNVRFINLKLYKYTYDHNESFHNNKRKRNKQKKNELYIRKLPKYDVVDFDEIEYFENNNDKKDYIFTTYFTKKADPQRNLFVKSNSIQYIKEWYESVKKMELNAVIFHDNLSSEFINKYQTDKIKFFKVDTSSFPYSLNDLRFIVYYNYIINNKNIENVFMTDGNDVKVVQNPFKDKKLLQKICVGSEESNIHKNEWILNKNKIFQQSGFHLEYNYDSKVYNAGILGGSRINILKFLENMKNIMNDINNHHKDSNLDMIILNYVIYNILKENVNTEGKIHSVYKKYQNDRKDVYFIHK